MFVDKEKKRLLVDLPLTSPTGKIRIKSRNVFHEYGLPHAPRQELFSLNNYVEWQIGYDLDITNKKFKGRPTTLPDKRFTANNGKVKALYELSEYLYYFYSWGYITSEELTDILEFLSALPEENLLSNHRDCQIKRTHPVEKKINDVQFLGLTLEYPQLIHKFDAYEIIAEITIREKQRAVGVQPMLYFCFPITEIKTSQPLIGRTARLKEHGEFVIDENNYRILVEMVRIFGMLSPAHNKDIIEIIKTTININGGLLF